MLTEQEQKIYNLHLAISRSALKKPFTLRQNFDDFGEDNPNYVILKKLGNFFKKFPQVDIRNFFYAPYEIYQDNEYYNLNFYITRKAINIYSMYEKRLQEESPDSIDQLKFIAKSLKFVSKFCQEHKIDFDSYLDYKNPDATIEEFLVHFKEKKVSLYLLLVIPGFENKVYSFDKELQELFFGDIVNKIHAYKIKLHQSLKAKTILESYIKKLNNFLRHSN